MVELPWCPLTRTKRTGFVTWRPETEARCVPLLKYVQEGAARRGLCLTYDVRYGGAPTELIYTECMGSLGGVIVTPADPATSQQLYARADGRAINNGAHDFGPLAEQADDKYILSNYAAELPEKVVILPGSNLLCRESINLESLRQAVRSGALIKPHPMTNQKYRRILSNSWPGKIIPRTFSGAACIKAAKEVWVSGASELGLYSILIGKRVHDISATQDGGYCDLFSYLMAAPSAAKQRLNHILSHPELSGVFVPNPFFDVYARVDQYLDAALSKLPAPRVTMGEHSS